MLSQPRGLPGPNQAIKIIQSESGLLVDSLAIADGVELEHASVLKLVRTHEASLAAFGRVGFQIRPFATAGGTQNRQVALLNEHQATLLGTFMKNSAKVVAFKVALVKAFYEMREALEKRRGPALPDFTNPAEAAKAWAAQYERALVEERKVQALAPKAALADQITASADAMHVSAAAKVLGIKPGELWDHLKAKGWVYRLGRNQLPRQEKVNQGLMTFKHTPYQHPSKGPQTAAVALLTPKGVVRLQREMRLGELPLFAQGGAS